MEEYVRVVFFSFFIILIFNLICLKVNYIHVV